MHRRFWRLSAHQQPAQDIAIPCRWPPVVIWDQAALAPFIKEHGAGITVPSLSVLADALNPISTEEYTRMRENARDISKKLRDGHFLKHAIDEAMLRPMP